MPTIHRTLVRSYAYPGSPSAAATKVVSKKRKTAAAEDLDDSDTSIRTIRPVPVKSLFRAQNDFEAEKAGAEDEERPTTGNSYPAYRQRTKKGSAYDEMRATAEKRREFLGDSVETDFDEDNESDDYQPSSPTPIARGGKRARRVENKNHLPPDAPAQSSRPTRRIFHQLSPVKASGSTLKNNDLPEISSDDDEELPPVWKICRSALSQETTPPRQAPGFISSATLLPAENTSLTTYGSSPPSLPPNQIAETHPVQCPSESTGSDPIIRLGTPSIRDPNTRLPKVSFYGYSTWGGQDAYRTCVAYDDLVNNVKPEDMACIVKARNFTHYGNYANMPNLDVARFSPDTRHKWITLDNNPQPVIGIIVGGVASCNLMTPVAPPGQPRHLVKSIALALLQVDLQDNVSLWGHLFGVSSFSAPYEPATGLWFQTRRRLPNQTLPSAEPNFKGKGKGGFVRRLPQSLNPNQISASLPFETKIPIYEGRASQGHPFDFTVDDFNNLSSRPYWEGGRKELSEDNIVALGYAVNTWANTNNSAGSGSSPPGSSTHQFVSLNLRFAIVLH
ncbi:hypothetical protein BDN72DRAFT_906792 [Pluteus cervinus]|uniref:Uncharacterized protein n=1 Tax=Pluteus cervinus TaxID=181527 RepID=A0ACD2ZXW4_9AGAR|nr:hypothetical protein BDN72DRAFT_906792 [Pluteus cervinus]